MANKLKIKNPKLFYWDNKKIHIGYFNNLDDAKLARQLKAAELFGIYTNECEK